MLPASTWSDQDAGAFTIIVHPVQASKSIRREHLVGIYTGTITRWGDRSRISPVDQSRNSRVRLAFSKGALAMPIGSVQAVWIQQFRVHGRLPPPVRESDEQVIAFVSRTPGAIGYVSTQAAVGDSVRVLSLVD